MAQSVDVILEFLRRNRFSRAEAALLGELSIRPDVCGSLGTEREEEHEMDYRSSGGGSGELIAKEVECGIGGNDYQNKWRLASVGDASNGPNNNSLVTSSFSQLKISEEPRKHHGVGDASNGESTSKGLRGSTSEVSVDSELGVKRVSERKELGEVSEAYDIYPNDKLVDSTWAKTNDSSDPSLDPWKDGSRKERKKKQEGSDIATVMKPQIDAFGKALFYAKSQGSSEQKHIVSLDSPFLTLNHKEELPRLPPVKLKSLYKSSNVHWEEKFDHNGSGGKLTSLDSNVLIGSFLDIPIGQEINASGEKRNVGSSWLSVSQGITEDASDWVPGFPNIGGSSDVIDYTNDYWDSDEYEDDDDIGYTRQPIEDETWFLAHEVDYPSDNERGTGQGSVPDQQERGPTKYEDDALSLPEDDSYFSGEKYFQSKNIEQIAAPDDPTGHSLAEMYQRDEESELITQYDRQLIDDQKLSLMRTEPVWQGFVTQQNDLIMLGNGQVLNEHEKPQRGLHIEDDQHGSVRSIGNELRCY